MKKLFFLFSLSFFLFSCDKLNETSTNTVDPQLTAVASEEDGQTEGSYSSLFDDVMGTSDEVGNFGSGIFGKEQGLDTLPRCFTMTVEHPRAPLPFPVVVTITFPPTGCIGRDGRIRRGKIRTEYSNRLIVPGAQSSTTFIDFSIDSISLRGTFTVRNTTDTTTNVRVPKWLVNVIGGRLGFPNGNVTEWSSEKLIQHVEGFTTAIPIDDIFKITGSAHGTSIRGGQTTSWNSEIIEPLVKRFTCFWLVKGRIRTVRTNISVNSPWIGVLDFGDGTCDNLATLTINGQTQIIHLR